MLESSVNMSFFRLFYISVAKFAVLLFLEDRLTLFLAVYDMFGVLLSPLLSTKLSILFIELKLDLSETYLWSLAFS